MDRETTPSALPSYQDPAAVRRPPTTARGLRTRAGLVAAARRVFERDGYVDSRLVDITREAQCSIGTFYTYFDSKEEVLAAVLDEAQHDMLHPGTGRVVDERDVVGVIRESNRAYFEAYARNAKLMRLLQQVELLDPRVRSVRGRRNAAFISRNAAAIRDLQRRGLADRGVDAELASMALSSMISRLASTHFGQAPGVASHSIDELVEVGTRLWTNALGLTTPQLRAD